MKEFFDYNGLIKKAAALMRGHRHPVSNLANLSALLWQYMPDINWAGAYINVDGTLVLGPFQGKPACVKIEFGQGVCGKAAKQRQTLLVQDVHAFPGHIACDSASRSEMVAPVITGEKLVAVLDVDSPLPGRFTAEDGDFLTRLAQLIAENCDWSRLA